VDIYGYEFYARIYEDGNEIMLLGIGKEEVTFHLEVVSTILAFVKRT